MMASKKTTHVGESGTFRAARCGEFPNDNPDLHDGTGWYDDDDLDREPIEVVDELSFDGVDEAPLGGDLEDEPALEAAPASEMPDTFATFVQVLAEVAQAFGADSGGEAVLRGLLGQGRGEGAGADARALAWQGVIRGESEDFGPCGAETLDEWAAALVSRVVAGSGKRELIRRELRRRGVAAFGFLADAA